VVLAGVAVAGCQSTPPLQQTAAVEPEILVVYPDGTMQFRERVMPEEDVIIYEDGRGGEKAAVRVRREPLHPDFFRDTIVVERR
jgi:hypothetical protein